MRVMILDDQGSVIDGILTGVDFVALGIDQVECAASAQEAREIITARKVDILLCDIEMPGENGLELNKWIREHYPEMLRILLTCHADFAYAQEGIKLDCFDYIVQPAPYSEIEESLRRAVQKTLANQQASTLCQLGKVCKSNELDLVESTVISLYSKHPQNVEHGLHLLGELNYSINRQSKIQLIILEPYPYSNASAPATTRVIKDALIDSMVAAGIADAEHAFVSLNRFVQFSTMLFGKPDTVSFATDSQFRNFYDKLTQTLGVATACYIGDCIDFSEIRSELQRLHGFIDNNVTKKAELYLHCSVNTRTAASVDLSECMPRWRQLLKNGQKSILRSEIIMRIEHIAASGSANFRNLCSLHQQLTQFFFGYLFEYDSKISITDLFTPAYSYNDYMDGVKSIEALKESVIRIIEALDAIQTGDAFQDDVERAQTYILANLSQNITVKEVADHVYLSPEYFTKLFKRRTGKNIKDYILQAKVDMAKELLRSSSLSISMIGLELGYGNFSHFCQMFKKYENRTPSEFRKKESTLPPEDAAEDGKL